MQVKHSTQEHLSIDLKNVTWCQESVDASLLDISSNFRGGNTEF